MYFHVIEYLNKWLRIDIFNEILVICRLCTVSHVPTNIYISIEFFHNWLLLGPGCKLLIVCLNSRNIMIVVCSLSCCFILIFITLCYRQCFQIYPYDSRNCLDMCKIYNIAYHLLLPKYALILLCQRSCVWKRSFMYPEPWLKIMENIFTPNEFAFWDRCMVSPLFIFSVRPIADKKLIMQICDRQNRAFIFADIYIDGHIVLQVDN